MAGRRQKGPSTEELLEKLEQRFEAFREEHNKELQDMKHGYEVSIELIKKEFEEEIRKMRGENEEMRSDHQGRVHLFLLCLLSRTTQSSQPLIIDRLFYPQTATHHVLNVPFY